MNFSMSQLQQGLFVFATLCFAVALMGTGVPSAVMLACKVAVPLSAAVMIWLRYFTRSRFDWLIGAMVMVSLVFSYSFFFITDYHLYMNDIDGHLAYIKVIAETGKLPQPFDIPPGYGWQSAAPPLYYLVAALFYKAGAWMGMSDPFCAARFLSVILYTGFIFTSVAALRYYVSGSYLAMALCLVLFAPDTVTYASRISSDVMMIAAHGIIFYCATRWLVSHDMRFLRYGWMAALAALAVKTTAIADIGAMGMLTAIALYKKHITVRPLLDRWMALSALWGFIPNFGRTIYYKLQGVPVHWLQNLDKPESYSWAQETTIGTFLWFDLPGYFHYAFPYNEPNGSKYFWNFFLKSILFGERDYASGPILAYVLCGLLLALAMYVVAYLLIRCRPRLDSPDMGLLIFAACMLGSLLLARFNVPWAAQCHIRYIFGVLVIFGVWLARAVEWHIESRQRIAAAFGMALMAAFVAVSAVTTILDLRAF